MAALVSEKSKNAGTEKWCTAAANAVPNDEMRSLA